MAHLEAHPFYIYSSIFVIFWALASLFDNFLFTLGLCAGCGLLCEILRQFLDHKEQKDSKEDDSGTGFPAFEAPTKPLPPEPESDNEANNEDGTGGGADEDDECLVVRSLESFQNEKNALEDERGIGNQANAKTGDFKDEDFESEAHLIDEDHGRGTAEEKETIHNSKSEIEVREKTIEEDYTIEEPQLSLRTHESYHNEKLEDGDNLDIEQPECHSSKAEDRRSDNIFGGQAKTTDDHGEVHEIHGISNDQLSDSDEDDDAFPDEKNPVQLNIGEDKSVDGDEEKPKRRSESEDDSEEGPDDVEDDDDDDIELVLGNKSVDSSSSSSEYEERGVRRNIPESEQPIASKDYDEKVSKQSADEKDGNNIPKILDYEEKLEAKTSNPSLSSAVGSVSHDLLSDFTSEASKDRLVTTKESQISPPFTAPVLNFESPKGHAGGEEVDGADDKLTFLLQDAQIDDDSSSSSSSDGPNFQSRSLVDEGDPWSSNKRDSLGETVSQPDSDELVYDISHRAVFGDEGDADEGELDEDLEADGVNPNPSSPRDTLQPETTFTNNLTKLTKSEDEVNPDEKSKRSDIPPSEASPLNYVLHQASGASTLTDSATTSSKYNLSEENMFGLDGVSHNISHVDDLVKPTTLPQPLISSELKFAELQRVSPGAEEEASLIDIE